MCCLFGIVDYRQNLTQKQMNQMLSVLASACEARGTDATGIAYNEGRYLRIYKRPKAAHKMHFRVPETIRVVMGHTRLATQGDAKKNENNHPFLGHGKDGDFALAHNGVLWNDVLLRESMNLPKTRIETDSYIAVQLLERQGVLRFESLRHTVEQLSGTFTLTVLDEQDDLYFVRGDNPMCLYHLPRRGLYLYASTEEILLCAMKKLRLLGEEVVSIELQCGELLKIDAMGKISREKFDTIGLWDYCYPPLYPIPRLTSHSSYADELKTVAQGYGYAPEEVDDLLHSGFTPEEVEEYLYTGEL